MRGKQRKWIQNEGDRRADRQTYTQTYIQTARLTHFERTEAQIDRPTERHTDIYTDRHADMYTDGQKDIQTYRTTDRDRDKMLYKNKYMEPLLQFVILIYIAPLREEIITGTPYASLDDVECHLNTLGDN